MSIQKAIKSIALSVLFAVGVVSLSMPAQAAMVATAQMGGVTDSQIFGQEVMQQKRDWIQTQLEVSGVSRADSVLRVSGLSDSQVIQVHQRMDEMPAGGDALGVALVVFIVLVITDVMGATDIFPFIRPVKQ
jgi:hypothetical protein